MKVDRARGFAKVDWQRSIQWGVADVDLAGGVANVIVTSDGSNVDTPSEFAKVDVPRGFCIRLFWKVNAC
jgi:hypothetical protein